VNGYGFGYSNLQISDRGMQNQLRLKIKMALDKITEKDIKGWFKHCGHCTEPS
jgi:hypothetical protein